MGYEVLIRPTGGPEGGLYLGSITDVRDLAEWVDALPDGRFEALKALVSGGEPVDPGAACAEIDPALEAYPPSRPGVAATAEALAEILDRWPDGSRATLSDGVNS